MISCIAVLDRNMLSEKRKCFIFRTWLFPRLTILIIIISIVPLSAQKDTLSVRARFIRDTGFDGKVTQDPFGYQIHMISGTFPDLALPSLKDMDQLSAYCEAVIIKLQPYILAPRHQLERRYLSRWGGSYLQKVNGYTTERGYGLEFRSFDNNRVLVINSTRPISDSLVAVRMTREEAVNNALEDWKTTQYYKPDFKTEDIGATLCYCRDYQNIDLLRFTLQWVVPLPGYTYYYNASDSALNKRKWNQGDVIGFYE